MQLNLIAWENSGFLDPKHCCDSSIRTAQEFVLVDDFVPDKIFLQRQLRKAGQKPANLNIGGGGHNTTPVGSSRTVRRIPLLIAVCVITFPAYGKYSGGSGTPDDPYQIAMAEDLMLLGEMPEDYDKHFIMTADIDLYPNLPGRKVFDRAVIAPDTGDTGFGGLRAARSLVASTAAIIQSRIYSLPLLFDGRSGWLYTSVLYIVTIPCQDQ